MSVWNETEVILSEYIDFSEKKVKKKKTRNIVKGEIAVWQEQKVLCS